MKASVVRLFSTLISRDFLHPHDLNGGVVSAIEQKMQPRSCSHHTVRSTFRIQPGSQTGGRSTYNCNAGRAGFNMRTNPAQSGPEPAMQQHWRPQPSLRQPGMARVNTTSNCTRCSETSQHVQPIPPDGVRYTSNTAAATGACWRAAGPSQWQNPSIAAIPRSQPGPRTHTGTFTGHFVPQQRTMFGVPANRPEPSPWTSPGAPRHNTSPWTSPGAPRYNTSPWTSCNLNHQTPFTPRYASRTYAHNAWQFPMHPGVLEPTRFRFHCEDSTSRSPKKGERFT